MSSLLILNPNSSRAVTEAIAGVAAACLPPGSYAVHQIDAGPSVIEDEPAASQAAELVSEYLQAQRSSFEAFVVACHGDPGVTEARRHTGRNVCGIGAASFRAAAAHGGHFGVITLGGGLVDSKWRQLARCGLSDRCVSVEPTNTGVLEYLTGDQPALAPYLEAGRRAIGRGADVLVLGCAGMAPAARAVRRALRVPVIEPVEAGIREAVSAAAPGA